MATPDYNQWLASVWGWPDENFGAISFFANASNVVMGSNPPYSVADFLAMYPNFIGARATVAGSIDGTANLVSGLTTTYGITPGVLIAGTSLLPGTLVTDVLMGALTPTGNTTQGSDALVSVSSTAGCFIGQPIAGPGIPSGTVIRGVGGSSLLLSKLCTATAAAVALTVSTITLALSTTPTGSGPVTLTAYVGNLVPLPVINVYIAAASGSLVQARWCELWPLGMSLYIAHFLTLWLKAAGGVAGTPYQAAMNGLAFGIETSKSADGLSKGSTLVGGTGLEDWGAWNLTSFGQQFATFAKGVGAGAMFLW